MKQEIVLRGAGHLQIPVYLNFDSWPARVSEIGGSEAMRLSVVQPDPNLPMWVENTSLHYP